MGLVECLLQKQMTDAESHHNNFNWHFDSYNWKVIRWRELANKYFRENGLLHYKKHNSEQNSNYFVQSYAYVFLILVSLKVIQIYDEIRKGYVMIFDTEITYFLKILSCVIFFLFQMMKNTSMMQIYM